MIRAMSTAVTGLRGHQQKLDVIGNNIANVNTIGFKMSQARFQDLLSQTIQGATGPDERGGINPSQIGMGMRISSITDIHSQGAITSTDRQTDLAIEGAGYFIVGDGTGAQYYTRAGSFGLDASGNLVNDNGLFVLGGENLNPINIPLGDEMIARATTGMRFVGNLDANIWNQGPAGRVTGSVVLTDVGFLGNATGGRVLTDDILQGITGDVDLGFDIDGAGPENMAIPAADMARVTTREMFLDAINNGIFNDADGANVNIAGWDGIATAVPPATASFNPAGQLVIESQSPTFPSSVRLSGDDVATFFGTPVYTDGSTLEDPTIDVNVNISFNVDGGSDQDMSITAAEMEAITTQDQLVDAINDGTGVAGWAGLTGATASIVDNNLRITSDSTDPNSRVEMSGPGVGILFGASPDFVEGVAEVYDYEYYIYDSLGRRLTVDFEFTPIDQNRWQYDLTVTDQEGNNIPVNAGSTGILQFTPNGALDPAASNIPNFELAPPGADPMVVTPDVADISQLAGSSTLVVREQDGYGAGELAGFYIDRTGIVVGTYTNGLIDNLGQIQTATFSNPEGLAKLGGNLFQETQNSGDPVVGDPGAGGRGLITASALEMSNTDLAFEFTELITTSRAFQANTRVVTTSDEILVEVVNMKR